jgi:small-conductance mechanosensitive channel
MRPKRYSIEGSIDNGFEPNRGRGTKAGAATLPSSHASYDLIVRRRALRCPRAERPIVSATGSAAVQNPPAESAGSALAQGVDFFARDFFLDGATWSKFGLTALVLLSAWLVRSVLQRVVRRTIDDRTLDNRNLQYRWNKTIGYVTWVLTVLLVASIWVDGLRQVGTFLGLFSAGVAIALKDVIVDLAGWVVIVTKAPVAIGDRVQIGENAGDVVDISVLHFTLLEIGNWVEADQSTGRVVRIPNAKILTEPIANYTAEFPYLWNEIPIVLTFESDWRKAKAIFLSVVQEQTEEISERASESFKQRPSRMLISYGTVTATVYTSVVSEGVCLTLRFLTEPRRRRGVQESLWEAVLGVIDDEPDIELAYPTTRIVNNGPGPFVPPDGDRV